MMQQPFTHTSSLFHKPHLVAYRALGVDRVGHISTLWEDYGLSGLILSQENSLPKYGSYHWWIGTAFVISISLQVLS